MGSLQSQHSPGGGGVSESATCWADASGLFLFGDPRGPTMRLTGSILMDGGIGSVRMLGLLVPAVSARRESLVAFPSVSSGVVRRPYALCPIGPQLLQCYLAGWLYCNRYCYFFQPSPPTLQSMARLRFDCVGRFASGVLSMDPVRPASDASSPGSPMATTAGDDNDTDGELRPLHKTAGRPHMRGAQELAHTGLFCLRHGHGPAGPCELIENLRTLLATEGSPLEVRPRPGRLRLRQLLRRLGLGEQSVVHEHMAGCGARCVCFTLTKSSPGVAAGADGAAMNLMWLDEWRARRLPRWISWLANAVGPAMPSAKVVYEPRRGRWALQWDIIDWQLASQMLCDTRASLSKSISQWQARFSCPLGGGDSRGNNVLARALGPRLCVCG